MGKRQRSWQSKWLPKKCTAPLLECPIEDFANSSVDSLRDPIKREWISELVDGLFVPEVAKSIKKIPLSRVASKDKLYWPYTSNGDYTCKSGYKYLKEEAELSAIPQAQTDSDKQLWKMIWSMKVPPKVKNLMWRACRNAMPTKTALLRRTITGSQLCDRCHVAQEDPLHALQACLKLDVVWSDVELWNFRNSVRFMDFKELLSWIIAEDKNMELFAVTAWSIWNQRNKV